MPSGSSAARQAKPEEEEIVITRSFEAPRELVFKAWTDSEYLTRWFSPESFTTPSAKCDPRVGGHFLYCMRSPEGKNYWGRGAYREINPPERIVYTDSFADAEGKPVPPSYYGMSASHPQEMLVTVTFDELAGGTKLTLRHSAPREFEERDEMQQGWNEMLDKLEQILKMY